MSWCWVGDYDTVSTRDGKSRGPPTLWATDQWSPWPVRKWATQKQVTGWQSERSFICVTSAPHHSCYCLSSTSCLSVALDSHRVFTVNYIYKGSRLWAPWGESSWKPSPYSLLCGTRVFCETNPWISKRLGTAGVENKLWGHSQYSSRKAVSTVNKAYV